MERIKTIIFVIKVILYIPIELVRMIPEALRKILLYLFMKPNFRWSNYFCYYYLCGYESKLLRLRKKLKVEDRVEFLGHIKMH